MRPRGSYTGGMGNHTYPHTIENGAGERMSFVRRVQDPPRDPPQGEEPVKPRRGPPVHIHHRGEEDLLCTGYVQPPDNVEYFLTAIYESQRESGGSRPDPFEAAFLMWRYRSEFYMAEIPAVVQRVGFPAPAGAGRLL